MFLFIDCATRLDFMKNERRCEALRRRFKLRMITIIVAAHAGMTEHASGPIFSYWRAGLAITCKGALTIPYFHLAARGKLASENAARCLPGP